MIKKNYQLHFIGLSENDGEISAKTLQNTLEALQTMAARATRLLVMGKGAGKGPKPLWLEASIDFTVTGLQPGSTVIDIQAPLFGDAAPDVFSQQALWNEMPSIEETALDVSIYAIEEALTTNSSGDRFDHSVLDAILNFKKAIKGNGAQLKLTGEGIPECQLLLDNVAREQLQQKLQTIPSPSAYIVSGVLEEMQYSGGKFCLQIEDGASLPGVIDSKHIEIESLRPLWGRQTTVEGVVRFKSDGHARLIEAQNIYLSQSGDRVFEERPFEPIENTKDWLKELDERARNFKLSALFGAWPGDESLEELMELLD